MAAAAAPVTGGVAAEADLRALLRKAEITGAQEEDQVTCVTKCEERNTARLRFLRFECSASCAQSLFSF